MHDLYADLEEDDSSGEGLGDSKYKHFEQHAMQK